MLVWRALGPVPLLVALSFAPATAGINEIATTGLQGAYVVSDFEPTTRTADIALNAAPETITGLALRLRGFCVNSTVRCDGTECPWPTEILGDFDEPGCPSFAWFSPPAGAFDLVADFRAPWDGQYLEDGVVRVTIECTLVGHGCDSFAYLQDGLVTLEYVALVLNTTLPARDATWSAIKRLYGE